jgi:hypothetical protein
MIYDDTLCIGETRRPRGGDRRAAKLARVARGRDVSSRLSWRESSLFERWRGPLLTGSILREKSFEGWRC